MPHALAGQLPRDRAELVIGEARSREPPRKKNQYDQAMSHSKNSSSVHRLSP
jgi:hypothetical protein